MGEVDILDEGPARSLSVAEPSNASVVLLSRFEEEGVEPPELWLRNRRPNSVLYMARRELMRQKPPLSLFVSAAGGSVSGHFALGFFVELLANASGFPEASLVKLENVVRAMSATQNGTLPSKCCFKDLLVPLVCRW